MTPEPIVDIKQLLIIELSRNGQEKRILSGSISQLAIDFVVLPVGIIGPSLLLTEFTSEYEPSSSLRKTIQPFRIYSLLIDLKAVEIPNFTSEKMDFKK